jgi:thiol-disulfide isomerase/thioredoxin
VIGGVVHYRLRTIWHFLAPCSSFLPAQKSLEIYRTRIHKIINTKVEIQFCLLSSGSPFNLADFKGKKVFVNLWASWCPPCRAEIPSIEKLYKKVDKRKAVFVLLSLDNDFETAVRFVIENKLASPVYYPAGNLPSPFNVQGIPVTFVFDEIGNLVTQMEGADNYDTEKYLNLFNK